MFNDRNPYLRALYVTILFFACVHLTLLAVYAISHGQIWLLNIFHILDLDKYFTGVALGWFSFIISLAFGLAVYLAAFFWNQRNND